MKPAVLKFRGQPFDPRPTPPRILKIKAALDKAPQDELFTVDDVGKMAGLSSSTVKDDSSAPQLSDYSCKVGTIRYWGNPKAIQTLRSQVDQ